MNNQRETNQYFTENFGYRNSHPEERPVISFYTRFAPTDDYDSTVGPNNRIKLGDYKTFKTEEKHEVSYNYTSVSTIVHSENLEIADEEKKDVKDKKITAKTEGKVKGVLSDFDVIMKQKREERVTKRKRPDEKNSLNKNREMIVEILTKMKGAAEKDKKLNASGKPASTKLMLLPYVLSKLGKPEFQSLYKEYDVLSVLANWLLPLKDKILPALVIRESILNLLIQCPPFDNDSLKHSGIGKAVNYLRKHRDETPENRERARILYNKWSRRILNLPIDHSGSYKKRKQEEENKKKLEEIEKKQKMEETFDMLRRYNNDNGVEVPTVSNKIYTVRPQSNVVESQSVKTIAGPMDRISKRMKKSKVSGHQVSIDGKKM